MKKQDLDVFEWSNDLSNLHMDDGLLVIALRTLPTTQRAEARKCIRDVIQEVLASLLNCTASEIKLLSQTGQAIKFLNENHNIGLSISHESMLSLVAINMNGQVGVDLMAIESIPDAAELQMIAKEYLGTRVAEYISSQPIGLQKVAFANAWTAFEASLKLKGDALTEWSTIVDEKLKNIQPIRLALSNGYVGYLAYEI